MKHVFDDVELVVSNNDLVAFNKCPVEKLKVIEMFENKARFIAMPANEMPDVVIMSFDGHCGTLMIGVVKLNFSLQENNVLYIRKH